MSDLMRAEPVELTDAELDVVSAGQISLGNLINVNVSNLLNNTQPRPQQRAQRIPEQSSRGEHDQHSERRRGYRRDLAQQRSSRIPWDPGGTNGLARL